MVDETIKELKEKRPGKLNKRKSNLESLRNEIKLDKGKFADKKIKEIDTLIPTLPDRKAKAENISMKEHLTEVRKRINKNKEKYADEVLNSIDESVTQIDEEITEENNGS